MEQIKEANKHISDALEQWATIVNKADADGWAFHLEYTDADLLNALTIFSHVASNIAIKKGILNEKNVVEKMKTFVKAVVDCYGFNTIELTKKVLSNEK